MGMQGPFGPRTVEACRKKMGEKEQEMIGQNPRVEGASPHPFQKKL
jgi:hypothetical protein